MREYSAIFEGRLKEYNRSEKPCLRYGRIILGQLLITVSKMPLELLDQCRIDKEK